MARLCTHTESGHYLMALDAGTGSVRAVIFDLQGKQIAVGQAEWQHLAVPDVPGSMEFDLAKTGNWLASVSVRHYRKPPSLQRLSLPYRPARCVKALLFMTVTANQFGPALMLTPARRTKSVN